MRFPTVVALAALTGCASIHNAHVQRTYDQMVAVCPIRPPATAVAVAQCQNQALLYKFGAWNPPDLVDADTLVAVRLRAAEQLDAGEITQGQAAEMIAHVEAQVNDAQYQRAVQAQKLRMQQLQMFMAPSSAVIYTNQ